MGLSCGIIGLPNVGKSTLLNALSAAGAAVANYPFCTIEPNIGVVPVPDPRLDLLTGLYRPERTVPTSMEFRDIAGLVAGASRGEGLGNRFLAHIREVDAVLHVVRCFRHPDVAHVAGDLDPVRDISIVETELLLKDLETAERRLAEAEKRAKGGDHEPREEAALLIRLRDCLREGRPALSLGRMSEKESHWVRDLHLLSLKPVLYVCNVGEASSGGESDLIAAVRSLARRSGARVAVLCAGIEAEISELPAGERESFLRELGLPESGLGQVIRECYDLLRLVTFFTVVGGKEVRAWTVERGTRAPQAAGRVHTDFEKGFIRAEVMRWSDLRQWGSEHELKERGLLRVEGRDYVVEEGDILQFRFHL
ncbi:MAG: redox-regulated ATPase YchF [Bacteroidota bacterium]